MLVNGLFFNNFFMFVSVAVFLSGKTDKHSRKHGEDIRLNIGDKHLQETHKDG